MKKRKGLKINFHLSNRLSYTLIVIGILIAIGVGVYAYGTNNPSAFGHSYNELQPCAAGQQILQMSGGSWTCVNIPTCNSGQFLQFDGTSWKCATPPLNPLTKSATGIYTITNSYCAGGGSLTTASTCSTRSSGTCWYGVANGGINYYSCTGGPYCVCASCAGPTCSNNLLGYLVN